MACIRGIRGLVLLFVVASAMDLAYARSLQQATAKPGTAAGAAAGTAAAAVLAVPRTPDPKACVGPTTPAKYRFMWTYVMKRASGPAQANLDALVTQWMVNCSNPRLGGKVVRYGHGPALTSDPAVYGRRTAPPPNWLLADFAAWSDWVSLADLYKCLDIGDKSGVLAQMRKFAKPWSSETGWSSSDMVLPLTAPQHVTGNPAQARKCPEPDSIAPATVRYFVFNYIDTDPDYIQAATDRFKQISTVTTEWIRAGVGDSVIPEPPLGIQMTHKLLAENSGDATFGSYRDFVNLAGLTADLTNPAALEARGAIHNASLRSFHVAIRMGAPDRSAERDARPASSPSPSPDPGLAGLVLDGPPAKKMAAPPAKTVATSSDPGLAGLLLGGPPAKTPAPASKTPAPASKPATAPSTAAAAALATQFG